MRSLHFCAIEPDPGRANRLRIQVSGALTPTDDYLRAAADRQRAQQTALRLKGRRIRRRVPLRLSPLDTVLRVPRQPERWRLTGPAAAHAGAPIMNVTRSTTVPLTIVSATPGGWVVALDPDSPAPRDGDSLFWGGEPCALERMARGGAPASVTIDGAPVEVVRTWSLDADAVAVCVAGRHDGGAVAADGVPVPFDPVDPFDDCALVDSTGALVGACRESITIEAAPAAGPLVSERGARFGWKVGGRTHRETGVWVALVDPGNGEAAMDPRARFCDAEPDAVWTDARYSPETTYEVLAIDRERLALCLDREPPAGATLHLPTNKRHIELMRRAIHQLQHAPLPHHAALLRLCRAPHPGLWPPFEPDSITVWTELVDPTRDGTEDQRDFVARALACPDYVQLEGPPGSGKTTALCELVRQLVRRGLRVLMCATTNAAIDNLLERLDRRAPEVVSLRVGKNGDDSTEHLQVETRRDALLAAWERSGHLAGLPAQEKRDAAERTLVAAANLVCATMEGVKNLPHLRHQEDDRDWGVAPWARPLTNGPCFDVLIVDEASKTPVQELLVPAVLARRVVVVGDVQQLSPFVDQDDLAAVLAAPPDAADADAIEAVHRACHQAFELCGDDARQSGARWLVVDDPRCLDALGRELAARGQGGDAVRIADDALPGPVRTVTPAAIAGGALAALHLVAARLVLVSRALLPDVQHLLPSGLITTRAPQGYDALLADDAAWLYRRAHADAQDRLLDRTVRSPEGRIDRPAAFETLVQRALGESTWARQVSWRLVRQHGLARGSRKADGLARDLRALGPHAPEHAGASAIDMVREVGLPSLLQAVQQGIGARRDRHTCALTVGLDHPQTRDAWESRFVRLRHQHRMHDEIACFPREHFYRKEGLLTANTVGQRPEDAAWTFAPALPARRVWIDVTGRVEDGANAREVDAVRDALQRFLRWASEHPRLGDAPWEVACLTFWTAQQRALRDMLRRLTGSQGETRFATPAAAIVCNTVDSFQGREADLVLLSMRNCERSVGHSDSPNRLNVALTRARQLLVIVGSRQTYGRRGSTEHRDLVTATQVATTCQMGGEG